MQRHRKKADFSGRKNEKYNIKIKDIDILTKQGKKLRNKLLVILKDNANLTYKEIIKIDIFRDLKYASLGKIYNRIKRKK